MESDANNKSSSEQPEDSFYGAAAVAQRWMLDFAFVSLCRYFKDEKFDEFEKTLKTFEAVVEGCSRLGTDGTNKKKISAFLARIMYGRQLDVKFDKNDHVMPLMSACKLWSSMAEAVADNSVFESITKLLYIQSVAVCLAQGQSSKASSALKWLTEERDLPQNLGVKLSVIVKKMDTYHPFLVNFSFRRLQEEVQAFLEAFLQEHPSDFLLQAATKVAQTAPDKEDQVDPVARRKSLKGTIKGTANESTDTFKENNESTILTRPRKKTLAKKNVELWKPDSAKKPVLHVKRLVDAEVSCLTFQEDSPDGKLNTTAAIKRRKVPQKWTYELDRQLKSGVHRHGEGKWSRILLEYDFQGRTGVMLKDRWRTLKKNCIVT